MLIFGTYSRSKSAQSAIWMYLIRLKAAFMRCLAYLFLMLKTRRFYPYFYISKICIKLALATFFRARAKVMLFWCTVSIGRDEVGKGL